MTTRGKIILTILVLVVVGFGVYRRWDKIAPQSKPQNVSVDVAKVREEIARAKAVPVDIPLLAGTNVATLVERSGIPAVSGVSDYKKEMKDGKPVVGFPINVWPGWAPIIMANAGMVLASSIAFFTLATSTETFCGLLWGAILSHQRYIPKPTTARTMIVKTIFPRVVIRLRGLG